MTVPADKIIVALDCGAEEALALARELSGQAQWLKVGMTLYYSAGSGLVYSLKELGFKVFVDLKLHDIPHQVRGAAAAVTVAGADLLTVHAAGGVEMMTAACEGARDAAMAAGQRPPAVIAITVLTSLDATNLASIGVPVPAVEEQVLRLARLAQGSGLDGVVSSPQEAAALRRELGAEPLIVTPGIRPASTRDDQKRVASPEQALQDGASYLVIGRPITKASSPRQAFWEITKETL